MIGIRLRRLTRGPVLPRDLEVEGEVVGALVAADVQDVAEVARGEHPHLGAVVLYGDVGGDGGAVDDELDVVPPHPRDLAQLLQAPQHPLRTGRAACSPPCERGSRARIRAPDPCWCPPTSTPTRAMGPPCSVSSGMADVQPASVRLFVMGPRAQNLDRLLVVEHLADQSVSYSSLRPCSLERVSVASSTVMGDLRRFKPNHTASQEALCDPPIVRKTIPWATTWRIPRSVGVKAAARRRPAPIRWPGVRPPVRSGPDRSSSDSFPLRRPG